MASILGRKPDKQKETETSRKKMKVIYKFSMGTLNPCENTKLALKVTFKDDVTEPKIRIVDDHTVSIYGVEHCEVVKEESTKLDRLLNLYLDKRVNPNDYESFQKKLSDKIELYKLEIEDLEKELKRLEPPEVKIEKAKQSVRRLLDFNYNGINDLLIEEVVEKITVHKDWFEWKLVFLNEPINLEVKGKKQDYFIVEHEK